MAGLLFWITSQVNNYSSEKPNYDKVVRYSKVLHLILSRQVSLKKNQSKFYLCTLVFLKDNVGTLFVPIPGKWQLVDTKETNETWFLVFEVFQMMDLLYLGKNILLRCWSIQDGEGDVWKIIDCIKGARCSQGLVRATAVSWPGGSQGLLTGRPIWAQTFRKGFDVDPGLTPHPQKIILS